MDMAHTAAFEAAFAHAEGSHPIQQWAEQAEASHSGEVAGVRLDPIFNGQISQLDTFSSPANTIFQNSPEKKSNFLIGSDAIPPIERIAAQTVEKYARESDELARTAGQLLHSVSGETSSKFQQSQFLTLMRRIRDREVEMRGTEFCEVEKNTNRIQDPPAISSSVEEAKLRPEFPEWQTYSQHEGGEATASQAARLGIDESDYRTQVDLLEESSRRDMARRTQQQVQIDAEFEAKLRGKRGENRKAPGLAKEEEDRQALHPGGRGYPVRETLQADGDEAQRDSQDRHADERHKYDHWASGGIGIEEEPVDESLGLAGRFSRVSVRD